MEAQLIIPQENSNNQYDVKYWSYGYSSVFTMKDINVIGYISKYMTKDIDNRLYGKRRYLCSHTLKVPHEFYLEKESKDLIYFLNKMGESKITYSKQYLDYYGNGIRFVEYKKRSD